MWRRWATSAGIALGRMVTIELIDPDPSRPRQVMGERSELIASIGGERRHLDRRWSGGAAVPDIGRRHVRQRASVQARLRGLPVVSQDVDDTEGIEPG